MLVPRFVQPADAGWEEGIAGAGSPGPQDAPGREVTSGQLQWLGLASQHPILENLEKGISEIWQSRDPEAP